MIRSVAVAIACLFVLVPGKSVAQFTPGDSVAADERVTIRENSSMPYGKTQTASSGTMFVVEEISEDGDFLKVTHDGFNGWFRASKAYSIKARRKREQRERKRDEIIESSCNEEDFSSAVIEGDLETARICLKAGMSPQTFIPLAREMGLDMTAAEMAVSKGHEQIVREMIGEGLDPDGRGVMRPYVHIALGHPDVLKLLLKYGANPNERDQTGFTPLASAILGEGMDKPADTQSMRILLEAGADHRVTVEGQEVVVFAAGARKRPAIEVLHEYGADINPRLPNGNLLVDQLESRGFTEIASYIRELESK